MAGPPSIKTIPSLVRDEKPLPTTKTPPMSDFSPAQQAMIELFQKHVGAELAGDLDTTMATMTDDPHLNHVPVMAGGVGR